MLISIIIPTYNRAHLIRETLDSIQAQTYQNWECIVVDDGSTDNTDAVMQEYCEKDSRFKYYHRPEEHLPGGNGARNYGFKISKGDFIKWFDSDDLMSQNLLKFQIEDITNKKTDLSICDFSVFKDNLIVKNYDNNIIEEIIFKDFVLKNIKLNLQVIIFNRQFVKEFKFNEHLKKSQDFDFIYKILKQKPHVSFKNKNLCLLRIHSQRISDSIRRLDLESINSSIQVRKLIIFDDLIKFSKSEKYIFIKSYLKIVEPLGLLLNFRLLYLNLKFLYDHNYISKLYFLVIFFKMFIKSIKWNSIKIFTKIKHYFKC